MSRRSLALCAVSVFVAGSAFATTNKAAWPTYAQSFQRAGRADGAGEISTPSVAWTKQLGGTLAAGQAYVADADGDGRPNFLTISGGRLIVSNPDGSMLWKGGLVGARGILGVWNLDGANTP